MIDEPFADVDEALAKADDKAARARRRLFGVLIFATLSSLASMAAVAYVWYMLANFGLDAF